MSKLPPKALIVAAALLAATGNLYAGLIYPIVVALITVVIGGLYIKESRQVKIWDEVGGEEVQPPYEAEPLARPAAS